MGGVVSGLGNAVGGLGKSVLGMAGGLLSGLMPKPPQMQMPMGIMSGAANSLLSPADPSNGTAQAEREAAADEERRRLASARGYTSTNPTGGTGDLSTPNLASKSLLGQ